MYPSHEPADQGVLSHWYAKGGGGTQRHGHRGPIGVNGVVRSFFRLELVLKKVYQIYSRRGSFVQVMFSAVLGVIPEAHSIVDLCVLRPARL